MKTMTSTTMRPCWSPAPPVAKRMCGGQGNRLAVPPRCAGQGADAFTTYDTDFNTLAEIRTGYLFKQAPRDTGSLLKDASRDELFGALRAVAHGRSVLPRRSPPSSSLWVCSPATTR